jgi:hypothetical protein
MLSAVANGGRASTPPAAVVELFPYGVDPTHYTPYRTLAAHLGMALHVGDGPALSMAPASLHVAATSQGWASPTEHGTTPWKRGPLHILNDRQRLVAWRTFLSSSRCR